MKLSKSMQGSLLFIAAVKPPCRCGRPGHYANLVVHNALIRRGLIHEASDDFHTTTLTAAGEVEVKKLTASSI